MLVFVISIIACIFAYSIMIVEIEYVDRYRDQLIFPIFGDYLWFVMITMTTG